MFCAGIVGNTLYERARPWIMGLAIRCKNVECAGLTIGWELYLNIVKNDPKYECMSREYVVWVDWISKYRLGMLAISHAHQI